MLANNVKLTEFQMELRNRFSALLELHITGTRPNKSLHLNAKLRLEQVNENIKIDLNRDTFKNKRKKEEALNNSRTRVSKHAASKAYNRACKQKSQEKCQKIQKKLHKLVTEAEDAARQNIKALYDNI